MARTKNFDEDEVLEKAMNLFWLKGYNGTSMQDLVDGLGISRSSLYDTYVDKHTLFLRSLEHYKSKAGESMGKIIQSRSTAKEKIKRMLEYIINELIKDKEQKGCILVNAGVELASQDKEVNAMLCQIGRQVENYFYEIFLDGQKSGEIAYKQADTVLAQFILNNIKGVRVTARTAADKSIFNDIISLTLSVLG